MRMSAGAIPITRIHHLSCEVADVERTSRFYQDVLGFTVIPRPPFDFDGAWLFRNGLQIHLIKGTPPQRDSTISTRRDHVAFHTDDLTAVEERLTSAGVLFRKNAASASGVVQIFFHDPDGNHIEVGSYPVPPQ